MFLIDQHAAHERVLYERLDRESAGPAGSVQPLLQPLEVALTARQRAERSSRCCRCCATCRLRPGLGQGGDAGLRCGPSGDVAGGVW